MSISDEAVEAAAKAIARATIERESKLLHQFFPASDFKSDARAALEAAAPSIMAAAWDAAAMECEAAGWLHGYGADDLRARNPYRK